MKQRPRQVQIWQVGFSYICFNMFKWRFKHALNMLNGVRTGFF
jgi:hypothetical protein